MSHDPLSYATLHSSRAFLIYRPSTVVRSICIKHLQSGPCCLSRISGTTGELCRCGPAKFAAFPTPTNHNCWALQDLDGFTCLVHWLIATAFHLLSTTSIYFFFIYQTSFLRRTVGTANRSRTPMRCENAGSSALPLISIYLMFDLD